MLNSLKRLMLMNRGRGAPIAVNAVNDESVVYLYDAIVATDQEAEFWGGVSAESVVKTLAGITTPIIHLRINSPGGDVFAGRAIENAIRQSDKTVVAHVDGLAASAASFVALAADSVEIAPGAFFMIHRAWTFAYGDSSDLLAAADLLDKIDESLVKTYAQETGRDPDEIRAWMDAETWFTADEAVANGFADGIMQSAVKNAAQWDLSAYKNAPVNSVLQDAEKKTKLESSKVLEGLRKKRERELALATV